MEHTTLHLLYSRFWHKFLYDIGIVPMKEPYRKRTSHGMILGEGGEKMSKSRGNVVNPNDIVAEFGADTMRLYIMFIGDFEKAAPWSSNAVKGCKRFLDRVWNLGESCSKEDVPNAATEGALHKTIKKVSEDIEGLKFNTAIAALMSLVNELSEKGASRADMKVLLCLLSPFAPHIAEEIWERLGFDGMVCKQPWPSYDEAKTVDAEIEMAVQVNGKLKATVLVPTDSSEEEIMARVRENPKLERQLAEMQLVKTILVKNKLINLILK
jgi:leucyl-tRNA synthetase